MTIDFRRIPTEIIITVAMLFCMTTFSLLFDLKILFPSGEKAQSVGIHYIYPLIGLLILGASTSLFGKSHVTSKLFVAIPCYIAILFAHFNIKLWIPHINPFVFDSFYWRIDNIFRPIIDICIYTRHAISGIIPYEANFYMISYISLFYISFLYHGIKTSEQFGKLIMSVLILQVIGTLGYLVAPAIGPFIYEPTLDPVISGGQSGMLQFYQLSLSKGPAWLATHGSENFTVGLAAMPSLHSASAFLFFIFAWKFGKVLLPLYTFILAFILLTAVASRWHYLIDVPVGMLVAWVSYRLAERFSPGMPEPSVSVTATGPIQAIA